MIATQTPFYQDEFTRFCKERSEPIPPWLMNIQQPALDRFLELGFPTTREEEWRFTNVAPLAKQTFTTATNGIVSSLAEQLLEKMSLDDDFHRLVFVNGRFADHWSTLHELPSGVVVGSLAQAIRRRPGATRQRLARYAGYERAPFTALNTAFVEDGAYIQTPKDVVIERPIHLMFLSCTENERILSNPRIVVALGAGSRATVIESHSGRGNETYFANVVTEVDVAESAELDHVKLQQEQDNAFHVATTQVHQRAGSRYRSRYFSLGGSLVRNELNSVLDGEGSQCMLHGLYMANGDQHVDSRTRIDHASPNCSSFEMYKGVLDGRAKGVFNGKIYVHPDAQKTDAKQSNHTLLLSDDAVIDTKPQLEIYADDVKCTHGATVGELDEQAFYYLRSRGIPAQLARSLLIFAFSNEIVQGVELEAVRKRLETILLSDRGLPQPVRKEII